MYNPGVGGDVTGEKEELDSWRDTHIAAKTSLGRDVAANQSVIVNLSRQKVYIIFRSSA